MARYVEILFRHWLRFALVLIVLPIPATVATVIYFRTYEAATNLWIDDPSTLNTNIKVPGWNQFITPAQNQADALTQMLATKSFDDALLDTAYANGGITSASEQQQIRLTVPLNIKVVPQGTHLLSIIYSCQRASVCTAVLSATVTVFHDRLTAIQKDQQDLAISFLQSQVAAAKVHLKASQDALQKYLAAHPGVLLPASYQVGLNPELDGLELQLQQDTSSVSLYEGQLAQAQYTADAAGRFVEISTRTVDPPRITKGGFLGDGSSERRALVVLAVCISAAAAYLLFLAWIDKTARDRKELEHRLQIPVLATIPQLRLE
jgi:hypothetical protein